MNAGCCDVVSVFAHLSKLYSPRDQEHGRFVHIIKYVTTIRFQQSLFWFLLLSELVNEYLCQDNLEQLTTWFMEGSYKNIW